MVEINRVVILGAGAVGASYASMFVRAGGFETAVLARGARYERLRRDGLLVNGTRYAVPVRHPDEAGPPADLILVALKHHHLAGALPDLQNLAGEQTLIVSLLNGLDSEQIIGAVYGMEKVLYAMVLGIDAVRLGHEVTYEGAGKIYFGEATNAEPGERVRRVGAAFTRAGIVHETPADMIRTLWWKFMVNVGMNQASAVMRAPYGVFQAMPEARALMEALMREVIVLAGREGVNLVAQDVDDWLDFLPSMSPQGKTSMLQDVEAGRQNEAEIFGGKVVALGRKHGVATPVNETVLRILQVLGRPASGEAA